MMKKNQDLKTQNNSLLHKVLWLALVASVIILVAIPTASTVGCVYQQKNWVKTQGTVIDHWKEYEMHNKESYEVRYCKVTYTWGEDEYTSTLSDTSVSNGESEITIYVDPENPEEAVSEDAIETGLVTNMLCSVIIVVMITSCAVINLYKYLKDH